MAIVQSSQRRIAVQRRTSLRRRRTTAAFYLFISPWLLGFVFLGIVPLVLGFLTSLTNYDGLNLANIKWVGLRNYSRAFADSEAIYAFGRTLLWTALNVPLWLVLSFGLALLMNQQVKGRGIFRTLYYLPGVIPAVASVWIWRILLDTNYGMLNGAISIVRPGTAIPWLSQYPLPAVTAIAVWQGLGSGMVIFLAGLQGISNELLEAAELDGASRWQALRYITIPLMTPVIFFQLVLALITSFQQLGLPLLLGIAATGTQAYVPRGIYLYMIHTYNQIFVYQRFGYGTALLWLMFLFILVVTLIVFKTSRFWVHYEVATEDEMA